MGSTMTCLIVSTPAIRALRFFAGGILTALVMIRGFGKQPVRNVQKGICFLVYFCISDEWNPAAVPPVYGYDESVFVIASAAYAVLKGIQSLWENIQENRSGSARYLDTE